MDRLIHVICSLLAAVLLSGCGDSGSSSGTGNNTSPVPQQRTASTGPVVMIGDSITQNWGNGNPASYTADPTIYQHIPGVVDVGIGGQQTWQMLARFQTDVLDRHPSVVVILGGTNDIFYGSQPVSIDNIAMMAEEAAAAGARVVIGLVPPTNHLNSLAAIQAWNAQLRLLCNAYGYAVADYYDVMLNPDGSPNLSLFQPDEIHPNSAGYGVMWKILQPMLQAE